LHLVNGIFQKKISTFPKFQFVKVNEAIPIASVVGKELEMVVLGKASQTNFTMTICHDRDP